MARPSKYQRAWNKRTQPLVEELMHNGGSILEACQMMGIGRETYYRWMKDPSKTAFRNKMAALLEASEAWWIRQGRENLGDRTFNAALYNLNMVNRFKWNSSQTEQTKIIKEKAKPVDVAGVIQKAKDDAQEREKPDLKLTKEEGVV